MITDLKLQQEAETLIKDFIQKNNSFELKELVYELLDSTWWEDQLHYYEETISALMTFLLTPKVNKKFFKDNPRLDIIVPQHLTRLALFFKDLQNAPRAQAEIELEHLQQKGKDLKQEDLNILIDKYKLLIKSKI